METEKLKEALSSELIDRVNEFYNGARASGPVEAIGELLINFFSGLDQHEKNDKGQPAAIYTTYEPHYISDLVFRAVDTINFIVNLKEAVDSYNKVANHEHVTA